MKNRAFTLIELLIVIAILGILAAILVPAVQRARHQLSLNSSSYNGVPASQSTPSENLIVEQPDVVQEPQQSEEYNSERELQFGETRYYVSYTFGYGCVGAANVIISRQVTDWDSIYGETNSLISELRKYKSLSNNTIVINNFIPILQR